jgi:hypothetical protein
MKTPNTSLNGSPRVERDPRAFESEAFSQRVFQIETRAPPGARRGAAKPSKYQRSRPSRRSGTALAYESARMGANGADGLLGGVVPEIERSMRFRVQRQGVLAANLANADTPGYRRAELHFEDALSSALAKTDPKHVSGASHTPGAQCGSVHAAGGGARAPDRDGAHGRHR